MLNFFYKQPDNVIDQNEAFFVLILKISQNNCIRFAHTNVFLKLFTFLLDHKVSRLDLIITQVDTVPKKKLE